MESEELHNLYGQQFLAAIAKEMEKKMRDQKTTEPVIKKATIIFKLTFAKDNLCKGNSLDKRKAPEEIDIKTLAIEELKKHDIHLDDKTNFQSQLTLIYKVLKQLGCPIIIKKGPGNKDIVTNWLWYGIEPNKSQFDEWLEKHNYISTTSNVKSTSQYPNVDINELVKEVREKVKPTIKKICGTIRIPGQKRIDLRRIFTDVKIVPELSRNQKLDDESQQACNIYDKNAFSSCVLKKLEGEREPKSGSDALNIDRKLMLCGTPGSGKTTLLKYLALKCSEGEINTELVPFFVRIRFFAYYKQDLVDYIVSKFFARESGDYSEKIIRLFKEGRALICLDSLDEVNEEESRTVLDKILLFLDRYSENSFIISCRSSLYKYVHIPSGFKEVEIQDFNLEQIESFAQQWFVEEHNLSANKYEYFLTNLRNQPNINSIAKSPLLLSLLCNIFDKRGEFPPNSSEIYQKALDVLLEEWDRERHIDPKNRKGETLYKELSIENKQNLLSEIAFETFCKDQTIFPQREVEEYIYNYFSRQDNKIQLDFDCTAVLEAIEHHHGLLEQATDGFHSFAHGAFQQYCTARRIATIYNQQELNNLVSQLTRENWYKWREVFIFATEIADRKSCSDQAEQLLKLIKQEIDKFISSDEAIQETLKWVHTISSSVHANYKPASVRAFHLIRAVVSSYFSASGLDLARADALDLDFELVYSLDSDLKLALEFALLTNFELKRARPFRRFRALSCIFEPEFRDSLKYYKVQFAQRHNVTETLETWWKKNKENDRQIWVELVRNAELKYRHISPPSLDLNENQRKKIVHYLKLTQLLIDCLDTLDKQVEKNKSLQREIEETLLLPMTEIES